MEKVVRIVKMGEDDSNVKYWLSLSYQERMANLEKMRQEVNERIYGTNHSQKVERVYRIVKLENKNDQKNSDK